MKKIIKKIGINKDCPRGLWHILIDDELPPDDEDYNKFEKFTITPEKWFKYREQVMSWWIENHPGTRPTFWWRFEKDGICHVYPAWSEKKKQKYLIKNKLLTPEEIKFLD